MVYVVGCVCVSHIWCMVVVVWICLDVLTSCSYLDNVFFDILDPFVLFGHPANCP